MVVLSGPTSCQRRRGAAHAESKYHSPEVSHRLGGVGGDLSIGSQSSIDLGEDRVEGASGPAERVGDRVPFGDELVDGALERGEVGEVGRAEPLASEDTE